ncbi:hypothetical protein EDD86DRAFT_181618, partial [Gorgonomyces haynaldii]
NVQELIQKQSRLSKLEFSINQLNKERNAIAKQVQTQTDKQVWIEKGKQVKMELQQLQQQLKQESEAFEALKSRLPNDMHPSVPVGDESQAQVIYDNGKRAYAFQPLDHIELCQKLDLADFERAGKVSGSRSYYLKGDGALLEMALTRYAMDICISNGFLPMTAPDMIRRSILDSCGFAPRSDDPQTYYLSTDEQKKELDPLVLTATAEFPLAGMYSKEVIEPTIKMAALGHAFRAEGLAGKTNRGLYRVHQFTKLEMFALTKPDDSMSVFHEFIDIQREILDGLELQYRVLNMPSEELGAPAFIKYDMEVWMPGRREYGEVSSTSNCTDYQSKRLSIRYLEKNKFHHVHTVNGTACAVPRLIISLLETHQQPDGSIHMPLKLQKYL